MAEKVDEGGWAVGEGPPSAAAYNSEEERLGALMPDTDEVALMEKRKLKVQKLIAKKKTVSLNPRKRYQQRKEERLHEKQKVAAALALVKEAAQESEESRRMFVEERRTWDAYELNTRNHSRMIKQEQENGAAAAEKRREEEGRRLACEEEGLTFDHGIVARYRRWRASPALAAVLPAHPCPAHAVRLSADGKWILSGGDDLVVRLWDIEAFAKELADPNANKAARAAKRVGQVAADVALGWKCVRELTGHAAAVRDVDFHPHFKGLPCGLAGTQRVGTPGTEAGGGAEASVAGIDATSGRGGTHTNDGGKTAPNQAGELVRVENMLASASADLSVRVWDLSYNPRIARFILRGHTGVVYACRFTPSGNRLASCSADTTVRLWNVLEGTEVFCYRGHTSPVTSLCFSATGRYLVSCSDIGERAIRMWFTGMPLYDREAAPFGLRLRWTRSGLVKRLRASTEPSAMDFFLNRQEDREARESSDESAGEKEFKERLKVPKSVLDQCTENPCPSKAVSDGFSLTVTLLNDSGKDVRTDEYYRGCKLVLRARSLKRFTGLYVAGVSAEGLWEGFDSRGGCRYGAFFKDVPDGMLLSAGRSIAAGDGFNRTAGGVYEVGLRWKANPREGVGWLMFRAAFTFPTHVGKRNTIGRQTVWVTLRERAPPMASAALFSTTKLKPRKRNFDTVGHTRLFANAIKNGDWAEASMLLSASARLNFGKTIARGAADVMDEIRNALGKNVIVGDGLSVGVAWTSIRMSHEPPAPPSPPTSPAAEHPATTSKSPRSTGSADASTVVAGTNKRQGSRNKQARDGDRRDSTAAHERNGDSAGLTRERPSTAMKKRARQKHKKRRARREGSVSGGSTGTRGCQLDRTEPRREGSQRRRRTGSARSLSTGRPGRRKASKRGGRRNAATSGSSGEEDAAALRASVEQDVRAELKHLRRLRDAGVESWKELGEATGALSLSKARKKASVRARAGRKGLLEGAGIIVKDPQVTR